MYWKIDSYLTVRVLVNILYRFYRQNNNINRAEFPGLSFTSGCTEAPVDDHICMERQPKQSVHDKVPNSTSNCVLPFQSFKITINAKTFAAPLAQYIPPKKGTSAERLLAFPIFQVAFPTVPFWGGGLS